jgi:hypothetical protein
MTTFFVRLRWLWVILLAIVWITLSATPALAFCGFYVAKADTKLYNQASQVIIARDGDRTVLTMANDYQGAVQDFAVVVPVPTVLTQDQVNVGDPAIIDRLDEFTAPRLVEYFDPDPCQPPQLFQDGLRSAAPSVNQAMSRAKDEASALGVTIESSFSVGEYDILILSAQDSNGLETWLRQNGYQIPAGASDLLRPYIRQGLKFFVAKVNLETFDRNGFSKLRPLQMAYESPRFMLPIRLGMVNAKSDQDLVVYLLSPTGRMELTNYRTVNIPSNEEIPVFVKDEFGDFYRAMFERSHIAQGRRVAFLEYAWDMAGCDPCSATPLSFEELRKAGVFWINPNTGNNVFVTRLHLRYNRDRFPEDLIFQETGNRQFYQGRYVLRHPFQGDLNCPAGQTYQRELRQRYDREAQTLANLTGWNLAEIRRKMPPVNTSSSPWWRNLWGN